MKFRLRDYEVSSAADGKSYVLSKVGVTGEFQVNGDKTANPGKETLAVIGYYQNIGSAVESLAALTANDKDTLKEWVAEYRAIKDEFLNSLG